MCHGRGTAHERSNRASQLPKGTPDLHKTTTLGYPRVGRKRIYKRILENYWSGKTGRETLLREAEELHADRLKTQEDAGIGLIACGDFSLYDHVLDTAVALGCIPARYGWDGGPPDVDLTFAMARGREGVPPCEMTKWFDTNYHYIVPELPVKFELTANKPLHDLRFAKNVLGGDAKPVILGPFTFLRLAKLSEQELIGRLQRLTPVYKEMLSKLSAEGVPLVQLDEPSLVADVSAEELSAIEESYASLAASGAPICLQTYYGDVAPHYERLCRLPVAALGLDFVAGREANLRALKTHGFPTDKTLVAGVINGRNVWRSDLEAAIRLSEELAGCVSPDRLILAPSCSLLHLPETVADEADLPEALKGGLCFARERLAELRLIARALHDGKDAVAADLETARTAREAFLSMPGRTDENVRERVKNLKESDFTRPPLSERTSAQRDGFELPLLPTTTIGSFPQTKEVRKARAEALKSEEGREAYGKFVRQEVEKVIRLQEEIGLDVLVHGEPERNDMVQFFSEQLQGYAATKQAWVQSYGSRCVRPPLLYGDIRRTGPMTVEMAKYAQSLTEKPVKGILTGPITMLRWSFVRDDMPQSEVALQLALAVRDEAADLERNAGVRIVQIDEAAFREALPLHRKDWDAHLKWAVRAFRLASAGVSPQTQVHTHMCYSEFGDIIEAIAALDADVISIEDARSGGEMLKTLRDFEYPAGIGPGVYDIHSPNVPTVEFILDKLRRTLAILPTGQVWVNPDCGLKTRRYEEVVPSLKNMVEAARQVREELNSLNTGRAEGVK
ncbi:MAG: 5-methyltetrahydropteroyltriglutamate--homocysteine S-methyltransferase [Armatimonadetes bacterium]|nr:5-methyltetrahydropteroyltriglutamate--homocysteine S-methyltransferase [Armatimonadota bacterium]